MPNPLIRQISFNHHQDCFALATDEGVRIFNSDPLIELINLKSQDVGSVRLVSLLNRTNLVAMVSGNPRPKFANNVVMIYDTKLKKFVVEVAVGGPILNIAFTTNRLIVVLHCFIYVFNTSNFELVRTEETSKNLQGLMTISPDNKLEILAYPGTKVGSVQLVNLQNASQSRSLAPSVIFAHNSPLSRIVLNNQATRIATGSIKGTVIKLFNTRTRELLLELRRGVDTAALHCLRFSYDSAYLAVSSDKGTIHIFSLSESDADKQSVQKIFDSIRFAKDERRSAVQFSLPNTEQVVECAFITSTMTSGLSEQPALDKDLIAIGYDGTYYRFSECSSKPQGHELLFDLAADQEFWNV
uniref:WD repeat domain phosphoinositide-interacting protein 4 n=1 Tax=Panagrolaimus sp. JU765 TaxID=591449 RepID=A0AC34QV63_9BILA